MSGPVIPWWRDAVGYSVYLRSFADTDADGVGDLHGVQDHLDHLQDLGVDLVWITPFYPSPLVDGGYDITDHTGVDPLYGDLAAFDELVEQIHRRRLRLLIDLVPNHTSIEHPWFQQGRSRPAGEYGGYHLWADPAPGGGPPNNWVSYFGGPAWTLDPARGQYYLHLFLPQQPDLNWRNPAVHREFERILRFWLDRGVDGFRVDVAQGLVKDRRLRSNPERRPSGPDDDRVQQWNAFEHRHDIAQPGSQAVFTAWRSLCARYDALLVGETSVATPEGLARMLPGTGLHAGFWLPPARIGWDPPALRRALTAPLAAVADPDTIAWAASTLDEHRPATRFGGGDLGRRRALALATLLFFLPGIPFLYQGEELGLVDGSVPPGAEIDPVSHDPGGGRDGARTPMPWRPGPALGFSGTSHTWLPLGGRSEADTVLRQQAQPASSLERYRALIQLRARLRPRRMGPVEVLDLGRDDVLAFRRNGLVAVANLGSRPASVPLTGRVLYDTHDLLTGSVGGLRLAEAQVVVLSESGLAAAPGDGA